MLAVGLICFARDPTEQKLISMFTCHIYILFQLFMYEAMGLCPPGRGGELIDSVEWIPNKKGNTFSTEFFHFIFEIRK